MYTTQPDGSITKSEILTKDEAAQLLLDHQAAIDGAKASIASYTAQKEAEITEHQAIIDSLTPAVDQAVSIVAAAEALLP